MIRKPIFSPSVSLIAGLHMHTSDGRYVASLFDIETGRPISLPYDATLPSVGGGLDSGSGYLAYNNAYNNSNNNSNSKGQAVAPAICFGHGVGGDNVFLADGVLYDTRTHQVIHRFDRLFAHGHSVFHPNGSHLIIDQGEFGI